jgi:hypothetical protein
MSGSSLRNAQWKMSNGNPVNAPTSRLAGCQFFISHFPFPLDTSACRGSWL